MRIEKAYIVENEIITTVAPVEVNHNFIPCYIVLDQTESLHVDYVEDYLTFPTYEEAEEELKEAKEAI